MPLNWSTACSSNLTPRLIDEALLTGKPRLKLAVIHEICISRSFCVQKGIAADPVKLYPVYNVCLAGLTGDLRLIGRCSLRHRLVNGLPFA